MIQLFLFTWLAGQAATSDAMRHVQAGLVARQQHNVGVEIAEFRQATEIDPSLTDPFVNRGAAYMEKCDYGAAIAPLKRALELNPDLAVANQFLGYALLVQGYVADAIPHLDRVGAQEALGIAQIETGQLTEAAANFTAALAKRPADPDLLYYLGHASGLLCKTAIDNLIANHPDSAPRPSDACGELLCPPAKCLRRRRKIWRLCDCRQTYRTCISSSARFTRTPRSG